MADRTRANLCRESTAPRLTDWQLRQSLINTGQHSPLVFYLGELIDGSRRQKIMAELRMVPTLAPVMIEDRIEAARWLFAVHPKRAMKMFAKPRESRKSLAFLFGVDQRQIPSRCEVHDFQRKRNSKLTPCTINTPSILVGREIYFQAKAACKEHGVSLSDAIRGLISELASSCQEKT